MFLAAAGVSALCALALVGSAGAALPSNCSQAERNVIAGGSGDDRISAGGGRDLVCAGAGNDRVRGGSGNDRLLGQAGKDTLSGGTGRDVLNGGQGNDRIVGGPGNDKTYGGPGNDVLYSGPGNDTIHARDHHRDLVACGAGRDVAFVDPVDVVGGCERVLPHPQVTGGDNGGNDCVASLEFLDVAAVLQSSSKWDTDTWADGSPPLDVSAFHNVDVESDGGFGRGCHNETVWNAIAGNGAVGVTITIDITWEWTKLPVSTCTLSNQAAQCTRNDGGGQITWLIQST